MQESIANTNVSFEMLHGSGDFLNIVLNNITSCVLLLNKDMKLHAFNDSLRTIFSNRKDEDLRFIKCGEAIGCAYQIEEHLECGNTSKCCSCELRIAALHSYTKNVAIYKEHITKPFFNYEGIKEDKHLQFSTRLFPFKKEKYIIMIIEDISKYVELQKQLN